MAAQGGFEGSAAKKARTDDGPKQVSDSDDDDDDDDVMPAVAAFLEDSDDEASSSSSSSDGEEGDAVAPAAAPASGASASSIGKPASEEAEKLAGAAAASPPIVDAGTGDSAGPEMQAAELPVAAEPPAPPSPSSSSSSSSSSSDSDSESEAEAAPEEEQDDAPLQRRPAVRPRVRPEKVAAAAVIEEENVEDEVNYYHVAKRAMLKRDEVAKMLTLLPLEVAEEAILRCFVRLVVTTPGEQHAGCVLAEVVGLEPSEKYQVSRFDGEMSTVRFKVLCRRGASERSMKISVISNHDLTEAEFDTWKRVVAKTGVDLTVFTDGMLRKAADIHNARSFNYSDEVVTAMLKKKGIKEFDAQKESRMRFLVQCTLSQMDISGIRDSEIKELEQRFQESAGQLQVQEAKAAEHQSEWFDRRPNLYSLKMINKKNYDRQVFDDRHALEFTLENECADAPLNPFERRACRPVMAWDLSLTPSAADTNAAAEPVADSGAATAAAADVNATTAPSAKVPAAADRMSRLLQAHGRAGHLLAGLPGLSG